MMPGKPAKFLDRMKSSDVVINYSIHDLFNTPKSAPILPWNADPGPGGPTAGTDTGNRGSINEDLLISSGGGTTDPVYYYGSQAKVPGLALGAVAYQNGGSANLVLMLGWDSNGAGALNDPRFCFYIAANFRAIDGSISYNQDIGDYVVDTAYKCILIALDTLMVWCVKGGAYTEWTMLHKAALVAGLADPAYPGINSYNRNSGVKEFNVAPLPAPWNSDAVVSGFNNGDEITGRRALNVLDAFFCYNPLTFNDLRAYFNSSGSSVGVERNGDDYWLFQDIGNGYYWFAQLKWDAGDATHALEGSLIKDGPTLADATIVTLMNTGAVWEYALSIPNAGGPGITEWVGNFHGHDPEASISFEVDGSPVVLADGERSSGTESVVVTRESDWTADAGADTHIADCTTIYTMRPQTGLDIQITVDWNTPAWPEQDGHMAMWPELKATFDRGILVGQPAIVHLNLWAGVDISSDYHNTNGLCAFESSGNWGMLLTTLDERERSSFYQERQFIEKMYTQETATDGVQLGSRYQIGYFSSTDFLKNV